jgi:hypothetical protein
MKRGRPNIISYPKRFSTTLSTDEYLALNELAVFEECSMAHIIRKACYEFLTRNGRGIVK